MPNPSYEQVSSKATGHAEAVEIVYDPGKVSYERLVEYFWHTIDPTVRDQQFCDRGSPYRTAIFAHDAKQLQVAQASRAALEKSKPFKEPIVTEIPLAPTFYPAEDYHQGLLPEKAGALQSTTEPVAAVTPVSRSSGGESRQVKQMHPGARSATARLLIAIRCSASAR